MEPSQDALAWMMLTRAPELEAAALGAALRVFGHAGELIAASDAARGGAGLTRAAREFLSSAAAAPSAAERAWLEHPAHSILPFADSRYPGCLRRIDACPIALYVAGSTDALNDPQLAVVGSRNSSAHGRGTAFEFAQSLARAGLAITSGLAEGIDSAAHRGALAARGLTLGVLGSGIDVIYPRCNRALGEEIQRHGALVSEFPLGTPPRRANFPRRNRIIAGLSLGTLVVEAAPTSGSLITARLAWEQGREVFAVPGSIQNPLSRGCHELLRRGAKLAETPADILSELDFSAYFAEPPAAGAGPARCDAMASGMDNDHKILLDALGFDPADLDTLVARTGFEAQAVSSMMLILELEGHVQAAPGGRYSRVANRSRR